MIMTIMEVFSFFQQSMPIGIVVLIVLLSMVLWDIGAMKVSLIKINEKLNNHITDTTKEISDLKKAVHDGHKEIYKLLIDILRKKS